MFRKRAFRFQRPGWDSNPQPSDRQSDALTNCATGPNHERLASLTGQNIMRPSGAAQDRFPGLPTPVLSGKVSTRISATSTLGTSGEGSSSRSRREEQAMFLCVDESWRLDASTQTSATSTPGTSGEGSSSRSRREEQAMFLSADEPRRLNVSTQASQLPPLVLRAKDRRRDQGEGRRRCSSSSTSLDADIGDETRPKGL